MNNNSVFIEPGILLKGTVDINPSKSYCHRYLVIGALCILSGRASGITVGISSLCDDVRATLDCLESMGVRCEISDDTVRLSNKDIPDEYFPELNCGESGSTLRFILPAAAVIYSSFYVNGLNSLSVRPIDQYLYCLGANGLFFEKISDFSLPLKVRGRLRAGEYSLPGNISSQFISGLLMSLPFVSGNSSVRVTSELQSLPYVKMTLDSLSKFGIFWKHSDDYTSFEWSSCSFENIPDILIPEGDWSSASFWCGANFLGSDINVLGLNKDSLQGDRRIKDMLSMIAKRRHIDVSDTPDIFPVLAVCAALRRGTTVFKGIERLEYKESNRLRSVISLINGIGGNAVRSCGRVTVYGEDILPGGTVDSFGDHRIAMAACIAASRTKDGIKLTDYDVTDKSYPSFYNDYIKLGGKFNVCHMG